jgi:hypothetical protein
MPKNSHGNSRKGEGAGGWQVDNVNRARDNRRVLPKRGDKQVNKANRNAHKNDARATRANEKARKKANSGSCAVTALALGGAVTALAAAWKGWT